MKDKFKLSYWVNLDPYTEISYSSTKIRHHPLNTLWSKFYTDSKYVGILGDNTKNKPHGWFSTSLIILRSVDSIILYNIHSLSAFLTILEFSIRISVKGGNY